jgi:hypothetical protein
MITTNKKIRVYDDTGSGDVFELTKVLYEDEGHIVALVENEWYDVPLKVFIDKNKREVFHSELQFYYAENY